MNGRQRSLVIAWLAVAIMLSTPALLLARGTHIEPSSPSWADPSSELPAVKLRIALDRMLGEHAFLVMETMRTGISGGTDFDEAAAALEGNTADLVELIDSVYSRQSAEAFGDEWRNHHAYLVDYTRALAAGDADAQAVANDQLQRYIADLSALLHRINPFLSASVLQPLIAEHVQQLEQVAALGTESYQRAYPAIRQTYAHMFMLGDALTAAIARQFPNRFAGSAVAFGPALDMRIALDRLLGEHTALAGLAMRARLFGDADAAASAEALRANGRDLEGVVRQVYGEAAYGTFQSIWRGHLDVYLAYVDATARDDARGEASALDGLGQFESRFTTFLAGANPHLEAAQLRGLVQMHDQQLVDRVKALASDDYARAYQIGREGFRHTESMADALATAIARQFPQVFPDTSTTRQPADRGGWSALVAALGVLGLAVGIWRAGSSPRDHRIRGRTAVE
jgi:hypothetical protein